MSTIALAPQVSYDARRPAPVRLTRRGRVAVMVLGLLLALGAAVWLAAGSVASDEAGVVQVEVVTVDHGETLWDIAADAAAGGDVLTMMDRIRDLNTFEGNLLQAGQELRVPLD
ncbi:LysM peptidoglycan-binding domain-containing protein [Nocardioides panacisoli]|uniref:LysM peptidoglycan-binding domain-containing protein n=1 Tax=Nocardioides panacisoli TaxID=627624 RepID=UPI001C636899|nr:LysM peptidoglycan-binding domain-containing protein [Nocardioides panacisoli]QYJ02735.1 LysM peptidoglycan-binding domain-containing protein [Nocardioides panacisoli]